MALLPTFRDICEDMDHFHSHFFNDLPVDLDSDFFNNYCSHWHRPRSLHWPHWYCDEFKGFWRSGRLCCPKVSFNKDGLEITMHVKQFKPDEVKVKTLDNVVQIEAQHKEHKDKRGFLSRQFVRRYTLPRGYNPEQVISTMSSDGILTIKAPAPKDTPEIAEREVSIKMVTE